MELLTRERFFLKLIFSIEVKKFKQLPKKVVIQNQPIISRINLIKKLKHRSEVKVKVERKRKRAFEFFEKSFCPSTVIELVFFFSSHHYRIIPN